MRRLGRFDYHEPGSLAEAIEILGGENGAARPVAGGTDLIVDIKTARLVPRAVVNLKRIRGLTGIEAVDGATRIGALTGVAAIEASGLIRDRHPALVQAAGVLATPPIRRLATIGGNIGRASPASDLAPPLIVCRATATIHGPHGVREEPVEDLFVGPGATTLAPGDVITSVSVPAPPPGHGAVHLKIGTRGGGTDIAVVGVSAGVRLSDDGVIAEARIALASVGPTPLRAFEAERLLEDSVPSDQVLGAAAAAAADACHPISDLRAGASHRLALVRVLTGRALRAAVSAAGGAP